MNSVSIIGRLTKDVEMRYSQGAEPMAIAKFTVAVNRQKQGEADFISCIAFKKTAETIEQYVKKGHQVGITGHIQTGSYDNKEGVKVYTTEVIVDRLTFLKKAEKKEDKPQERPPVESSEGFVPVSDDLDDDSLPF